MLVDRGFQRSGKYVYRPMMKSTCCPQYVFRTDVCKFKLSKSQKASLKKFKRYLIEGRIESSNAAPGDRNPKQVNVLDSSTANESSATTNIFISQIEPTDDASPTDQKPSQEGQFQEKKTVPLICSGVGPDPNKPPCKKAKLLRQDKKAQKELVARKKLKVSDSTLLSSNDNIPKLSTEERSSSMLSQNLSEYLMFPKHEECIHKFRTQLVPIDKIHQDADKTLQESFLVFRKFQVGVHAETEEDSKYQQFQSFLLDTPLTTEKHTDDIIYGSFHLQYLLDERIFAVGVLDILPKGVLSEYLYYDPDYRFLAPGVISALMEISLTQQYYRQDSGMQYYYMGYYVQSCPKMNYKRRYSASSLLCPETNTYVALDKCIPILKCHPYSRLADPEIQDDVETYSDEELHSITLLIGDGTLEYGRYRESYGVELDSVMRAYMKMVGKLLAVRMKVYATDILYTSSECVDI